ncbi:Thiamine pyrophosphokinase 2 [Glycine soja]
MELMCHCSSFLLPPENPNTTCSLSLKYALVVLNQSLPRFAPLLWDHAQVRVCADGGANRVYDEMPLFFPHQQPSHVRTRYNDMSLLPLVLADRYKPDVIKGDMDSIRTEVLDFYAKLIASIHVMQKMNSKLNLLVLTKGTKIIDESHDQDTTDLHKCVAYIRDLTPNIDGAELCILVAGALGGRFDHEIGNINVLCRFSNTRIILLSDDCLIHLLPKNHCHKIFVQSSVEGPHCGVIPIGMPSGSSTTTGLKWDLNDAAMSFGGLISTSNIVKGEIVTSNGLLVAALLCGSGPLPQQLQSSTTPPISDMLPLSLLKTAQGHPMLVELKNGETYNGHLVNCDTWMNIHLREVICTSKDGDRFWRMPECYIRGNTIKYLRVPDEVIDKVQEETKSRAGDLIRRDKGRLQRIANHLEWDVEGEEAERMVLVGAQQKELGVVLMMVVPRELEEAEAGVVPVESLVETEGEVEADSKKWQELLNVYR